MTNFVLKALQEVVGKRCQDYGTRSDYWTRGRGRTYHGLDKRTIRAQRARNSKQFTRQRRNV